MIAIKPSVSKYTNKQIKEKGYSEVINMPMSYKKINKIINNISIENK